MSVTLCLGPNPALDVTYRLPRWERGQAHRVPEVHSRAGGKATNVARVVRQLGGSSELIAPLGGATGDAFARDMQGSGVVLDVLDTGLETRRSVAVVDATGDATVFNEAGLDCAAWLEDALVERVEQRLRRGDVGAFTINGSLPPGLDHQLIGRLVALAKAQQVPVLVDTSAALLACMSFAPDIVKPNREELIDAIGDTGQDAVRTLWVISPGTVFVASEGADGVLCAIPPARFITNPRIRRWAEPEESWWRVPAPVIPVTNPTGAGDAMVASVCTSLICGDDVETMARRAVATSAAAVQHPLAGVVDPELATTLTHTLRAHRVHTDELNHTY